MQASRITLRRRQHLALEQFEPDDVLRIDKGCVILQSQEPGGRALVGLLLFAGDEIARAAAPPLTGIGLTAAGPAVVLKVGRIGEVGRSGATNDTSTCMALAQLAARSALHSITLNELKAEQRLATFLVELGLRFGNPTPAGCAFELPLSRTDIAHYLALNPDTMSRLMSRLKARQLIATPSRGWAVIKKLDELASLTPLAEALGRLWPNARCREGGEAKTGA